MGLVMGCGILAKGPVALLIPLGALCLFAILRGERRWRCFPKSAFVWALLPVGLWLACLVWETWLQDAWSYLHNILFKQTVNRYAVPWHHHKPFYYYLMVLCYDFFPWWPMLLAVVPWRATMRTASSERQRFAWAAIVIC